MPELNEKKIKYRELKNYKYELFNGYMIQTDIFPELNIYEPNEENPLIVLTRKGMLCIFPGYAWDGASKPAYNSKNFLRGSLVHDALYQLMRQKRISLDNRDKADRLLQSICIEDGMSKFRAAYVYYAVKLFAKNAATPKDEKETNEIILEAPLR